MAADEQQALLLGKLAGARIVETAALRGKEDGVGPGSRLIGNGGSGAKRLLGIGGSGAFAGRLSGTGAVAGYLARSVGSALPRCPIGRIGATARRCA